MRNIQKFFVRGLILFSFVLLSSCSKDNSPTEPVNPPPNGSVYTFSYIQSNVFNTTCAVSGCHAGSSPQAGLNLSSGSAYNNLINVKSVLYPNFDRVEPGSSQNSLIIKLLRGTLQPKMPQGGSLSSSVIDSIAAWIDRGAPNN